jgi:hypothetical protein
MNREIGIVYTNYGMVVFDSLVGFLSFKDGRVPEMG